MKGATRPGQRRQDVPACAAGGLGIGRDHRDAGLDQVGPVADGFGIALADQEDDRAGERGRIVRQPGLPVGRKPAASSQCIDIGKPEVNGQRRMGVALARDESIEAARAKATRAAQAVVVEQ